MVVVSGETPLTNQELDDALRRLRSSGLVSFQVDGGRVMAPTKEREQYRLALQTPESSTPRRIERWQSTDSLLGQFAGSRRQELDRDEARARLIGELLTQLPEVEQAEIVWDEERGTGWRRPPRVRATVYLKPRPDNAISVDTVAAVRLAVSSSKAHLAPADVVVMDLERMVTYAGTESDEAASHQRNSRLTDAHRTRIESALADIEGVRVSIAVHQRDRSHPGEDSHGARADRPPLESPTSGGRVHHTTNHAMEVPASFDGTPDPEIPLLNIVVRVPGNYLQQQLASRLVAPDDASPAGVSEALVEEVESAVKDSIRGRINRLIASGPQLAELESLDIELEPLVILSDSNSGARSPAGWPFLRSASLEMNSWSTWAMIIGLAASACWWLTDVARWYAWDATTETTADDDSPLSAPPQDKPVGAEVPSCAVADAAASAGSEQDTSPQWNPEDFNRTRPASMDEILELHAADLATAYAELPADVWATALRGSTAAVETHLLKALPAPQAAQLRRALRSARPVRLRDIEEAQQAVLSLWVAAGGA